MDAQQAQQKAKSMLKQEGIDNLLVKLFLAVKHYPSWMTRDDFDSKWNFGVTSIHSSPDSSKRPTSTVLTPAGLVRPRDELRLAT